MDIVLIIPEHMGGEPVAPGREDFGPSALGHKDYTLVSLGHRDYVPSTLA